MALKKLRKENGLLIGELSFPLRDVVKVQLGAFPVCHHHYKRGDRVAF